MSYKPGDVITALFAGAAETKRRPVIVCIKLALTELDDITEQS